MDRGARAPRRTALRLGATGPPDVVLGRSLTPDAFAAARASMAVHSRNGTVFSRPGRCLA